MNSSKKTILFITLICWMPLTLHVNIADVTSDFSKLEEKLTNIIEKEDIPSLHIGIVHQNNLIWSKGLGSQTDQETVFLIGSIQKCFIGTAILQLYEKGEIKLDNNINDYLPFEVKHPNYPEIAITYRMLLTHTAGLTDAGSNHEFYWDTEGIFYPKYRPYSNPILLNMSLEEYLNSTFTVGGLNYDPTIWLSKPGVEYHYANPGFKLLHYLIERISGQSFDDYMHENIFNPLNMTNTGVNASDFINNHATPYSRINDENEELPIYSSWQIRSSVSDMSHFLMAHMNNGRYGDYELLTSESVAMMHKRYVSYPYYENPRFRNINNYYLQHNGYGFGWNQYTDGFEGHGGSTPGFLSQMVCKKTEAGPFGIIVFMNINCILRFPGNPNSVFTSFATIKTNIFFELNLIPRVDQVFIDTLFTIVTFMYFLLLVPVYLTRVYGRKRILTFLRNSLPILCLYFSVLWILNSFNMFNQFRLIVSLPIILVLGYDIIHRVITKKSAMDYLDKITKANFIYDGLLFLGSLGLIIYNFQGSYTTGLIMLFIFSISSLAYLHFYYMKKIRTPSYDGKLTTSEHEEL